MEKRPAWATVTAVGAGLVALGLLVYVVGLFIPSTTAAVLTGNFALAFAVFGIAVVAAGVAWKLLRVRQ